MLPFLPRCRRVSVPKAVAPVAEEAMTELQKQRAERKAEEERLRKQAADAVKAIGAKASA